ncbi:hypothetical protein EIM44_00260 [Bibersteinia trehalosi]|uniref:Uncharacterized protein n=3 Tax=Bibersteinia trehalosi TaxID=47735 RepID=A0A3R8LDK6_BIBTR|nr:hypothetical protein [Bibersteinia trehalosi]RRN06285.1 hypothetical protein EIM44_00260 [Bibersteinia trehalosi]
MLHNRIILICFLSFIPAAIWIANIIINIMGIMPNWGFELILTGAGWFITGRILTWSYSRQKLSSHKERQAIAIGSFINFLTYYVSKEFRAEPDVFLSIQYGITEAFMVLNAIYFSPILLLVFKQNRVLNQNKSANRWK